MARKSAAPKTKTPYRRTGEMVIQDNFQRRLEEGFASAKLDQHVMLWDSNDQDLRKDPLTQAMRPLVVMDSLDKTTDASFNPRQTRHIRANIRGLVDSIEIVNGGVFDAWLKAHSHIQISVRELAIIAANHLANLYENAQYGKLTNTWRMMLAFGERLAWSKHGEKFGVSGDPRFLLAKDIPGATGRLKPLYYRPCFTNSECPQPFIDAPPEWLDEEMGGLKRQAEAEGARRMRRVSDGIDPRNQHAWIREFPMGQSQVEYADFALLVNGLPIVIVEMKTPEAGIKQAASDFQDKPTYQGAPMCLASDGAQAILSASMTGQLEGWVHYDHNIAERPLAAPQDPLDSCDYLAREILSRPERMEFLIMHCGAINEHGMYQVARAQQYQALAAWARDLVWVDICNAVLKAHKKPLISVGNRLIRHTQRTGKTHTMVRATHLALGLYPEIYRLGVVMVGEVLILGQIHEELLKNNTGLCDRSLVINRIESRSQLSKVLEHERAHDTYSTGRILLVNMQKISARETEAIELPDSEKTLVVVDEGHLAQTGLTADMRDIIFPKASHLLLTATPKDGMAQRYGIQKGFHVLDDFGYGIAQQAGIVCPTVFKRTPYALTNDPHKIAAFADSIQEAMSDGVKKEDLMNAISRVLMGDLDGLDEDNNENLSRAQEAARQIRRHIEREVIQDRLDALVDELIKYENNLEKDALGNPIFKPRALLFMRDTESAMDVIRFIWGLNAQGAPQDQRNVYRGIRFALDVSDFGKDAKGEIRSFSYFNPGIPDESALKRRMKALDATAVHVIIAVGKYTKGYDNNQLAVVALARNVGEVSLMNQIYTRPATMRVGKPKGVCLDLSFGLGNVACWNESMRLYDRNFDCEQLYTDERIFELVQKVENSMKNAASTLNMSLADLQDYSKVVAAFEDMSEDDRKETGRQFILHARQTADLISKMPDSSIYGALRKPLMGLRISLGKLQAFYPDLVESTDMNANGTLSGGHTEQSLGDILRRALSILGQSSLKALLDIQIGDAVEILPVQRDDALLKARTRQAVQAAEKAISAITGRGDGDEAGEDPATAQFKSRAMRSDSFLFDKLNRLLDKLRDDIHGRNVGAENSAKLLSDVQDVIAEIQHKMDANGGFLKNTIMRHLDAILFQRAERLGIDMNNSALEETLSVIVDEAATHMAHNFESWHKGLSAEWVDRPAKKLAKVWQDKYPKKNLTDFFDGAASRYDLHQKTAEEWITQLLTNHDPSQLRQLLGSHDDDKFKGIPPVIEHALTLALQERETIANAAQWHRSIQEGMTEGAC